MSEKPKAPKTEAYELDGLLSDVNPDVLDQEILRLLDDKNTLFREISNEDVDGVIAKYSERAGRLEPNTEGGLRFMLKNHWLDRKWRERVWRPATQEERSLLIAGGWTRGFSFDTGEYWDNDRYVGSFFTPQALEMQKKYEHERLKKDL